MGAADDPGQADPSRGVPPIQRVEVVDPVRRRGVHDPAAPGVDRRVLAPGAVPGQRGGLPRREIELPEVVLSPPPLHVDQGPAVGGPGGLTQDHPAPGRRVEEDLLVHGLEIDPEETRPPGGGRDACRLARGWVDRQIPAPDPLGLPGLAPLAVHGPEVLVVVIPLPEIAGEVPDPARAVLRGPAAAAVALRHRRGLPVGAGAAQAAHLVAVGVDPQEAAVGGEARPGVPLTAEAEAPPLGDPLAVPAIPPGLEGPLGRPPPLLVELREGGPEGPHREDAEGEGHPAPPLAVEGGLQPPQAVALGQPGGEEAPVEVPGVAPGQLQGAAVQLPQREEGPLERGHAQDLVEPGAPQAPAIGEAGLEGHRQALGEPRRPGLVGLDHLPQDPVRHPQEARGPVQVEDVDQLVGDQHPHPLVGAGELLVHQGRVCVEMDQVVRKGPGEAVGRVLVVEERQLDPLAGVIAHDPPHYRVGLLGHEEGLAGEGLHGPGIVEAEMIRGEGPPAQVRVAGPRRGREEERDHDEERGQGRGPLGSDEHVEDVASAQPRGKPRPLAGDAVYWHYSGG